MDPDANYRELMALAGSIVNATDRGESIDTGDAVRLAELVLALDEWLRR